VLRAALGAAGQKVYRCGPDGRTYRQSPCADGKPVDASDPRPAEQRVAAQTLSASEAKAAAPSIAIWPPPPHPRRARAGLAP